MYINIFIDRYTYMDVWTGLYACACEHKYITLGQVLTGTNFYLM